MMKESTDSKEYIPHRTVWFSERRARR